MARTTTRHTIFVQTAQKLGPNRLEAIGSAALLPGMLAQIKAAGGKLGKHGIAHGASAKLIVLPSETPDTITYPLVPNIDIPTTSGDTVYYAQGMPGDVVNAFLGTKSSVTKGVHFISSLANGYVQSCGTGLTVGGTCAIGVAWETVDVSGAAGTAAKRCLVRIV